MPSDPSKCVTALEIRTEDGEIRVVIILAGGLSLLMRRSGLTAVEAELFRDGIATALRWSRLNVAERDATRETIGSRATSREGALFIDGLLAGFEAAGKGCWLGAEPGPEKPVNVLH